MFKGYLAAAVDGRHLTRAEATEAMRIIMAGEATPAQIAGFLVALRQKGETTEELIGFAEVMRSCVVPLVHSQTSAIDTCGTGGDGSGTLNISTAAAIVAAAAGAVVAKHGNRSVSSRCGSADLLEQWGVRLELPPEAAARCLAENRIAFLFAPHYHPAMKHAAGPRRELGIRTVFNLLGPMTNPAGVKRQVLGVFDRKWVEPLARTLCALGTEHALVVSSHDGLDEISPNAPTEVAEVRMGQVKSFTIEPRQLGLEPVGLDSIQGGEASENGRRLESILKGTPDPAATAVALNAGAALYVAGLADSLTGGARRAAATLAAGSPWIQLENWAAWTQRQS
ncbi:MAG TPA: anthranilate phosphoribosyltransferase [Vicinamibacterales bacterium]|nr:anthranilate phosphoribosyltransferase [Vicinamibacterales bacterium]